VAGAVVVVLELKTWYFEQQESRGTEYTVHYDIKKQLTSRGPVKNNKGEAVDYSYK